LNFRQKLKLSKDGANWNHSNQKEVGDMYHKILVPLDGSKRADRILPHVEELAKRFKAKIIFLQVVEYKAVTSTPEGAFINVSEQELDQAKKQAEAHLKGIQGEFRGKNIESRTHVTYSPVVEGIINMASQEGVDLIALASHGRGGLSRVFYGSVAAGLLHRVDRPLLIIRSRGTE
jgi:nucleotide-binding universal stress UspA family protein